MENKNNAGSKSEDAAERYQDLTEDTMYAPDICSATDCTGLIPALPQSDSEITSYEQLYHFLPRAKETGRN